jgi:hypothetical protein
MYNVQHVSCFLVPFPSLPIFFRSLTIYFNSHILFVVTSFFLLGFILTLANFSSFLPQYYIFIQLVEKSTYTTHSYGLKKSEILLRSFPLLLFSVVRHIAPVPTLDDFFFIPHHLTINVPDGAGRNDLYAGKYTLWAIGRGGP